MRGIFVRLAGGKKLLNLAGLHSAEREGDMVTLTFGHDRSQERVAGAEADKLWADLDAEAENPGDHAADAERRRKLMAAASEQIAKAVANAVQKMESTGSSDAVMGVGGGGGGACIGGDGAVIKTIPPGKYVVSEGVVSPAPTTAPTTPPAEAPQEAGVAG